MISNPMGNNNQAIASNGVDNIFNNLLATIDQQVNASLTNVADNKQTSQVSFDNEFEDFFVRVTTQQ